MRNTQRIARNLLRYAIRAMSYAKCMLTKRRKKVLEFIKKYLDHQGYPPTYREIGQALKLSSPATVHEHVHNLAADGYLELDGNSIVLDARAYAVGEGAFTLPLLGEVQAGAPISVYEEPQTINIPQYLNLTGTANHFVLKVRGQSMIDEGIRDGDFVVCEKREQAKDGEVVVALVGGTETTLKTIFHDRKKHMIRLQPANTMMDPIFVRDVDIQGVVKAVFRRY